MRTACAVAAIAALSITTRGTMGQPAVWVDLTRPVSLDRPDTATALPSPLETGVPSPGTLALLGAAALVAGRGRRRKMSQAPFRASAPRPLTMSTLV